MISVDTTHQVADSALPALYRAADEVSRTARRRHSLLTGTYLFLLAAAAFVKSFTLATASERHAFTILSIIILSVAVFLAMVIRMLDFERSWYNGRAIAESVKSLAWRYMTRCQPYLGEKETEADRIFTADMRDIMAQRKDFSSGVSRTVASLPQITERMREVRKLDVAKRRSVYVSQRVDDQKTWYASQAELNRKLANGFSMAMISFQVLAIVAAILVAAWPDSPFNPVAFLVNIAVAILAWMEYQRHRELAQRYGVIAEELELIKEEAQQEETEKALSAFVSAAENAIAREHVLWLARRDQR